MSTKICNLIDNDILIVGAHNSENEYVIWQFGGEDSDGIHFEFNSQVNGRYDQVSEITIMRDGIHVVLKDRTIVHLYFNNVAEDAYQNFILGLKKIYKDQSSILEIIDC